MLGQLNCNYITAYLPVLEDKSLVIAMDYWPSRLRKFGF